MVAFTIITCYILCIRYNPLPTFYTQDLIKFPHLVTHNVEIGVHFADIFNVILIVYQSSPSKHGKMRQLTTPI
jgi:hypothetical protein